MARWYLSTGNSLLTLLEKMKVNREIFDKSQFTPLTKFCFVSRFCRNLVLNGIGTHGARDVYGPNVDMYEKEGETVAEIFANEAMRSFGDRMMSLESRHKFAEKLGQVIRKEFEMADVTSVENTPEPK